MADLSSLMNRIPVGDIAKKVGVDENVAEAAVQQILPGLISGMAANAADPKGAASLANAVSHDRGGIPTSVADVDVEDGAKIVKNIFGGNSDTVATKLADSSSAADVTGDLIKQILPIVAPIVLAWLANQFMGKKEEEPEAESTDVLGGLLGGLLGGGGGSTGGGATGDLIGGLLGGLLGGGKK